MSSEDLIKARGRASSMNSAHKEMVGMGIAPRQIGFRLYMSLISGSVGLLGLITPEIMFPGIWGEENLAGLSWLMLVCSFAGIFDVTLNDILDHRFDWKAAAKWRDAGYLGMAFAYLSLIYMAAKSGIPTAHDLLFGLNAIACIWIAVEDVVYRYVQPHLKSKGPT